MHTTWEEKCELSLVIWFQFFPIWVLLGLCPILFQASSLSMVTYLCFFFSIQVTYKSKVRQRSVFASWSANRTCHILSFVVGGGGSKDKLGEKNVQATQYLNPTAPKMMAMKLMWRMGTRLASKIEVTLYPHVSVFFISPGNTQRIARGLHSAKWVLGKFFPHLLNSSEIFSRF